MCIVLGLICFFIDFIILSNISLFGTSHECLSRNLVAPFFLVEFPFHFVVIGLHFR